MTLRGANLAFDSCFRHLIFKECYTVRGTPEVCHSLVVIFVTAETAAEQQREQDDQKKGYQASCCDHPHPLVRF